MEEGQDCNIFVCNKCGRYFAMESVVNTEKGRLCKLCGSVQWAPANRMPVWWKVIFYLTGRGWPK